MTTVSDADGFSEVTIAGGEFTGCTSTGNAGFIYVSDGATATISGDTVVSNCVAGRRAGVVSRVTVVVARNTEIV